MDMKKENYRNFRWKKEEGKSVGKVKKQYSLSPRRRSRFVPSSFLRGASWNDFETTLVRLWYDFVSSRLRNFSGNGRMVRNVYKLWPLCWGGLLLLALAGCRGEMPFIHYEEEEVTSGRGTGVVKGFFLLNEGNMGSNKASIDFFSYETGRYMRNIYPSRNPEIVKELGDVGNDIGIYGSKLYAVINCSHYVEVMDVSTAKHVGSIDVLNCRYITFSGGRAYVSSYAGPVQIDPDARPGKVVEVDTASLQVTREVVVGYQPEEMVVADGKLYVANSGGYRYPDYDTTVSVIDLESFQVVKTIDVAINLHRMELDRYGRIYVSSRGDYYDVGADVYVIDSRTDQVLGNLGVTASEMCLSGDSLYMTSVEWSYVTNSNTVAYTLYDVAREEVVSRNFITDGTDKQIQVPYGMAVNPDTKEILVCDAKDYVTPGTLYCFSPEGTLEWQVTTGDIPAHFAFTTTSFQE